MFGYTAILHAKHKHCPKTPACTRSIQTVNQFCFPPAFPFSFRFDEKESISGTQQLKSSVQKSIRNKLLEQFPHLENYADVILPKKDAFRIVRW